MLLLLQFAIGERLLAQNNGYQFSHLDITNGLSDNQVNCIFKDAKGFVWFGTTSGLNRYDGYKFKVFKHDIKDASSLAENHVMHVNEGPGNKLWIFTHTNLSVYDAATERFSNNIATEAALYHIPTDEITQVKKDRQGTYWFATNNRGLYAYNASANKTTFYSTSTHARLHSNHIQDIVATQPNVLWLIYTDGVIDQLDITSNRIVGRYYSLARANGNKAKKYIMMMDNRHNLWVCSDAAPIGVYRYNVSGNTLTHFNKDIPEHRLNSNVITSVVQTDDDKIWIGSDHGGINVVDPVTDKVTYILSKPDDSKSLSGNSLYLYKDNSGIIWAGTFKQGVNYYHSGIMQFPLYKHFVTDPKSVPFEDINTFEEDSSHNLWIGTNGSGLFLFNRATNTYTRFKHDPKDPNSLASDIIVRLHIDKRNRLWIGTYFGGLDCYDGKTFKHYRHNEKNPGSITDDRVFSIIEDANNELWVGTFMGGLNVFDPKTDSFKHPQYPMQSEYTAVIFEDRDKNKWIGRDQGIDVIMHSTGKVKHYTAVAGNINSLIGKDVNIIAQDKKGLMWIGTKDGLCILDPKTDKFVNIEEGINLPANNVSNIIEDNDGKMWVSTTNGLATINLTRAGDKYRAQINNYNELDGLQGRAFNLYAALKLRSGELVFGGIHGFNLFDPGIVNTFKPKANLVFTDLHLFNKIVGVGDKVNGNVVLTKALSETKEIVLQHNQNVFDIEFAACDYFNPDKVTFEYKLEGFDNNWTSVADNNRKATYTNLDGGDYVFKVRTHNAGGIKDDDTVALKITVKPPFFKSPVAYVSYFILLVGSLFYIRHRGIVKLKKEFAARQAEIEAERRIAKEREEARRMHELDLMKIKFFTNVSHEFRTPLSLIISPIDHLINNNSQPDQQQQLAMIKRNGKRLLNLVNQLLDFRKMEFKELKLCLNKGDIIDFIKDVCHSFSDLAERNRIKLLFDTEVDSFITRFDHDKIERILFNLLSNAFKFTSPGGHISIFACLKQCDKSRDGIQILELKVMDTGIGISKDKQEKIFDRFFQDNLPEGLLNQGSGIGLSISREFVRMHNGDISLESEPGNGSCFIIRLPLKTDIDRNGTELRSDKNGDAVKPPNTTTLDAAKKPTVLLIDDNDDMRFYLKDNLKHTFNIIEAVNGKDGWQKALSMHPDLIVSDVSMPEMNGIDLCHKIRNDNRTAHMPVILLTALIEEENQLAGTASGANDYITKPFNFEILLSKINGLLQMHQTLKKTYQKQLEIKAQNIDVVSEDQKFLKNVLACIEDNITNHNFSVEELSKQMSLSRVSLYKRLLTLTGKTPVDCIRTIRLKRAVQLLEKSQLSIANVAYEVGFNNPTYFSKVFKEEYNMLPSEYVVACRKKDTTALELIEQPSR
jgi:signal transduction histidine kinase/ligand-binding sensor domain-containing protein/DNA-binding response OmpR family regulator